MDPILYLSAKTKDKASIIAHGENVVLVSMPGGFDPVTGDALPTRDVGYQRKDIEAMRDAAQAQVKDAEVALVKAKDRFAAFDEIVAEIEAL